MGKTTDTKTVLVCQGCTCSAAGSDQVLQTFQSLAKPDFSISGCGCLGQCGNGPMVLVLPEEIWYCRVSPTAVPLIVQSHLIGGTPVPSLLYQKIKSSDLSDQADQGNPAVRWFALGSFMAIVAALLLWTLMLVSNQR
jgi:(2Fe-2S) ferredoxin